MVENMLNRLPSGQAKFQKQNQSINKLIQATESITARLKIANESLCDLKNLHQENLDEINAKNRHVIRERINSLQESIQFEITGLKDETVYLSEFNLDQRYTQTQQSILFKKILALTQSYNKIQYTASQKLFKETSRQQLISTNKKLTQKESNAALMVLEQRNAELLHLETSIEVLAGLFKDLQIVMHKSEGQLDSIEKFVDGVDVDLEKGSTDLGKCIEKAKRMQRYKRNVYCLCLLILIVLLIAGLLVRY